MSLVNHFKKDFYLSKLLKIDIEFSEFFSHFMSVLFLIGLVVTKEKIRLLIKAFLILNLHMRISMGM